MRGNFLLTDCSFDGIMAVDGGKMDNRDVKRVNLLPNIKKIRIPQEKFTQYALDFKRDKDKATAFQSALGYNKTNSDLLISNILSNIENFEAILKGDDGFGMRYEIIMSLTGVNGRTANVLTAWIDDKKANEMRLISAYIDKPKEVLK